MTKAPFLISPSGGLIIAVSTQLLAEAQRVATSIASQFSEGATQAATTVEQQMVSTQEIAAISSELAKTAALLHQVIKRFEW